MVACPRPVDGGAERPPRFARMRESFGRHVHLHHLLFLCFIAVAALPVALLAAWVERSAIEKEIAAVREKHLLVASNITSALSRYVTDIEAVFRLAIVNRPGGQNTPGVQELLRSLHFHHVCIVGADGTLESVQLADPARPFSLSPDVIALMRSKAEAAGGRISFTDVLRYHDAPAFFVVQMLDGGRFAMAAFATDYVVRLQTAIAFGERGHAAIVDRTGRVVAHPMKDWVLRSQDISAVPVVRQMLRGESGVGTFYSPAMKADMIAGFSVVPEVGWGVMVPQPMDELHDRAADVQNVALGIAAAGIILAGLISWWLAKLLARPIESVAATAFGIAAGNSRLRVPALRFAPYELRQLAATFNRMVDEIEIKEAEARSANTASHAKSQFLANISHELRAPLNAIIGFSEVMRAGTMGPLGHPRYREYVEDIHASATHQLKMINDLLDVAAAEAGGAEASMAESDITRVCGFAVRMIRQGAERAGVDVRTAIQPEIGIFRTDESRLAQILINLLSNAVKFTPTGGIVELRAERSGRDVTFVVRDTGIGIAAKDIRTAMAPFGRVANALGRVHDGSGLGLPLSRRLAESLGGRLDLASEPGKGTTVTVSLPVQRNPAPAAGASETTAVA